MKGNIQQKGELVFSQQTVRFLHPDEAQNALFIFSAYNNALVQSDFLYFSTLKGSGIVFS